MGVVRASIWLVVVVRGHGGLGLARGNDPVEDPENGPVELIAVRRRALGQSRWRHVGRGSEGPVLRQITLISEPDVPGRTRVQHAYGLRKARPPSVPRSRRETTHGTLPRQRAPFPGARGPDAQYLPPARPPDQVNSRHLRPRASPASPSYSSLPDEPRWSPPGSTCGGPGGAGSPRRARSTGPDNSGSSETFGLSPRHAPAHPALE